MTKKRRRSWGAGEVFPPGVMAATWSARLSVGGGRRRFKSGFASGVEARRWLDAERAKVNVARVGPGNVDPKRVGVLGDFATDYLAERKLTKKAGAEDASRWRVHLAPTFAGKRPGEVDSALIHDWVLEKLEEGLEPSTLTVALSVLSGLFRRLQRERLAAFNPCRALPEDTRALLRSKHDPTETPFLEKLDDVRRVFLALDEPINIGFALGALAGLRPKEAFALRWDAVDLETRRLFVRKADAKDKDPRVVPIGDALLPVLKAWKVKTGGTGVVVPPLRRDGLKVDKGTRGAAIRKVLKELGLPSLEPKPWYHATRHTFASHWVLGGGSIEKLSKVLGHYSIVQTEVYAHLRPDLFTAQDLAGLPVSLQVSQKSVSALPRKLKKVSK